jgi:hypothetical protein
VNDLDGVLQCLSMCVVARQRLGWHFPVGENARNNRKLLEASFMCGPPRIGGEPQDLCGLASLIRNGSVNTFPRHRKSFWRHSLLCGPCRRNSGDSIQVCMQIVSREFC